MLAHIEQLIALLSLQSNMGCEKEDDLPEYIETYSGNEQFHMEMEDGITLIVIPDPIYDVHHVYTLEGTPLVTLMFDDYEEAQEELELYAVERMYIL